MLFNEKIITVWSAPNYCNRFFNLASVLEISETLEIKKTDRVTI
jgi:serine/threonine-protein phosphatase 4 catalytic subunit